MNCCNDNNNINIVDLDEFISNSEPELIKVYESLCQAFPDLEPYLVLEFLINSPSNEVIENLISLSSNINKDNKVDNKDDSDDSMIEIPIIYPEQLYNNNIPDLDDYTIVDSDNLLLSSSIIEIIIYFIIYYLFFYYYY